MSPSVLSTYQSERLPVAYELIELDQMQGRIMDSREAPSVADVSQMVERMLKQNGTGVQYSPSALIAGPEWMSQDAAKNMRVGVRVPNTDVVNQSHGLTASMHSLLESTGLWRLLVFAGDVAKPEQLDLVNSLNKEIDSLAGRYPSASARQPEKFLEVLTVHASSVNDIESGDFASAFFPHDPVEGHTFDTIFGDFTDLATEESGGSHKAYGIDPSQGALVLVRPDQVVAWVGHLTDLNMMQDWLATFMIPCSTAKDIVRAQL